MQFFDTHCHLDFAVFAPRREVLIEEAAEAGLRHLLSPGVRSCDWPALLALTETPAPLELWAALGLHPCFAGEHRERADLAELERSLDQAGKRVIAIGEIGLDAWPGIGHWQMQQTLFKAQLDLAQQCALPVLLHVRKAHDQVLSELRKRPRLRGIVHAFSGSEQQGQQYLQQGFLLGVGGAFTHARATRLRAMLKTLPASALVLETDAPDMAPSWCARGDNSPVQVPKILAALARLRGEAPEPLAAQLLANSLGLFNLAERLRPSA